MEPTICVRRTQDSFGRRRGVMLMFAKFVPGLATLAAPVAGQNGMAYAAFLFFESSAPRSGWERCWPPGGCSAMRSSANPSLLNWVGRFSGALAAARDYRVLHRADVSPAHGAP